MKASKQQVSKWQSELAQMGHPCPVDGDPQGTETKAAAREYQTAKGIAADGLLGPVTGAALDEDCAPPFDASNQACYPSELDRAFFDALAKVEAAIHIPGESLMLVMQHESGLRPSAQYNDGRNVATGLIQFVRPQNFGWTGTVAELKAAPASAQVPLVGRYFAALRGTHDWVTLEQYCFVPASIKRGINSDDVVICAKDGTGYGGQEANFYAVNKALDLDGNGAITRGDLRRSLQGLLTNKRYVQCCKIYRALYPLNK